MKTLVISPTYNEVRNIETLIHKTLNGNNNDLLIIDDNSPDGTAEKVKKFQNKYPNLFLEIREKKLGLGTAYLMGFNWAIKRGYDSIVQIDADLSHDPNEIPKMMDILKTSSFVIGSRYVKGGKCEMSGHRLALSIIGNKFIKKVLKINCNEFTTSYRGFNLSKLGDFDLNMINSKGYSFFMETIYRLNKHQVNINEIPIHFKNRRHGYSKIPGIEIFRTLKNLFILYLENRQKK